MLIKRHSFNTATQITDAKQRISSDVKAQTPFNCENPKALKFQAIALFALFEPYPGLRAPKEEPTASRFMNSNFQLFAMTDSAIPKP
jgi:hypothetical protein